MSRRMQFNSYYQPLLADKHQVGPIWRSASGQVRVLRTVLHIEFEESEGRHLRVICTFRVREESFA